MNKIRVFPDACLRQKSQKVLRFDENLRKLANALRAVMQAQKMGIGIAAPQIGVLQRVVIVDVRSRIPAAQEHLLINPEILSGAGETLSHEGCMSLPEYTGYLKRNTRVHVRFQTLEGQTREFTAEGIEAVCLQHELDHLEGKLFFDHVLALKTDMLPRHWGSRSRKK